MYVIFCSFFFRSMFCWFLVNNISCIHVLQYHQINVRDLEKENKKVSNRDKKKNQVFAVPNQRFTSFFIVKLHPSVCVCVCVLNVCMHRFLSLFFCCCSWSNIVLLVFKETHIGFGTTANRQRFARACARAHTNNM